MTFRLSGLLLLACGALAAQAKDGAPRDVTEATRKNAAKLARLQKPGKVIFEDDFESPASLKKYFEIRGGQDGRAVLLTDQARAHRGKGAIRFIAPERGGRASGAGASGWLGRSGYDRVHFRRYIRFHETYDQGNLNHTGGGLAGVSGDGKWDGMGKAGVKPKGDDRFTCGFEPWRDWGRYESPGYMFLYTYWVDMKRDRDGNWWGNMLEPAKEHRVVPKRGKWVCLEQMIRANTPGKADGEAAAWIDGRLYLHMTGIRWRTSARVRIKRFDIGIYIHRARQKNICDYDDVVLSTGYVGPCKESASNVRKR